MAKDPAFLFYPGDYLRDTQTLSEKSQVAYDRIMCEHMRNICITQQQLKFFTKRLNKDEKEELTFILDKVDGGYQIGWVAESLVKRRNYSESRRNNRLAVKKDKVDTSKSYVPHMENANENKNKDKDIINNKIDFEIFWNAYDKKRDKPKCKSKWDKLSLETQQKIIDYIPSYKLSQPDKQYRKDPTTFLNNESWENEIIKPSNNGNGQQIMTQKEKKFNVIG